MRGREPYGEPRECGAESPGIEEEPMNSHLLQGIATGRARDMRHEATAASAARAAQSARPGHRSVKAAPGAVGRLVRRTVHP